MLRFLAGGCLVSLFAAIGEVLEPKSFAGLFGAAPSVALATLGLTIVSQGLAYAGLECRSMTIGAIAFGFYSVILTWLLARRRVSALKSAVGALGCWFAVAFGLWFFLLHSTMHSPIKITADKLKQVKYSEFAIRFLLGGVITVLAGFVAQHYGPAVGGLFLAFPAILPATATLIANHEQERKAAKGLHGDKLALAAAALDTNGAALGSIGLLGFAAVAWWLLPRLAPALVLLIATITWLILSLTAWLLRRYLRRAQFRRA